MQTAKRSDVSALILALGLGVVVGAGCQQGPAADDAYLSFVAGPVDGGTFRISLESVDRLDPASVDDVYEATVSNQIFSGLVHWDADLNVLPDIATSWTISRDGLEYVFELNPEARFHTGRQVVAEDFVYSFSRLFFPETPPGIIQDYLIRVDGVAEFAAEEADHIRGMEALDAHTLRIRLHSPYPSFLSVLCMDQAKVVPRELIEEIGSDAFGLQPVGTGPFRLAQWVPDKRVVLVRSENYYRTPAHLDSVIMVHNPSDQGERSREDFLADRLDMHEVREAEVPQLRAKRTVRIVRRLELSMEFLGFNVTLAPFDDRRVRRAVAMALDYDALQEAAGVGFKRPVGLLPPGMAGYTPDAKLIPLDIEGARTLLGEAGYDETNPLRFEILSSSRTVHAAIRDSVVIRSLARAGIQAVVRNVGWRELNEGIDNRTAPAYQITWIADLPDPDSFLYTLLASDGVYNLFDYGNARVDSLLDAGRGELEVPVRLGRYREAEKLVLADAPLIPLFNVMTSFALQPRVKGVEMSPFGICSVPFQKIWLKPESEEIYAAF